MDNEIFSIAEEIDDYGWNVMMEEIQKEGQISLQQLKIAAQKYIFIFERLKQQTDAFKALLQAQKNIRYKIPNNFKELEEYQKNKQMISQFLAGDIPKLIYKSSLDFQQILNNFLGQKVTMVFVYEGSNGPELYELNSYEVLKYDYSKNNSLIARYNVNSQNLSAVATKLEIDADLKFNLAGLKGTYAEVLYRYEVARNKNKRQVLWKLNNKWSGLTVSAKGDINEAYAVFVLQNAPYPKFESHIEENVRDFMMEGVRKVNNISGLLQGDTTMGNIEYGIKSAGASTLGLKQILSIAKMINQEDFSKEKLLMKKNEFKNKGKTRNKLVEQINDTYEDLIKEIQNRKT